jgi:pyruvate-formate lyase
MDIETAQVFSAQEQAILDGKKVLHGTATDRVLRMFDAIRSYGTPRVALERAVYFTESFKTTEGQPLVWRWAKALKHIAENISVAIFDDGLIVGRANTWFGAKCPVIFMTAHENPEWRQRAKKAGAVAYLKKPFHDRSLLDAIQLTCREGA